MRKVMKVIIQYGSTWLSLRPFSVKVLLHTMTPDFFKKKFENTQASVSTGSQSRTTSAQTKITKEHWWNDNDRGHRSTRSKHIRLPLRPPQAHWNWSGIKHGPPLTINCHNKGLALPDYKKETCFLSHRSLIFERALLWGRFPGFALLSFW